MEAFVVIILVSIGLYVLSGIKIVNQYQRGVVLTLGKFTGVREPGLRVVIPGLQTMMLVDIRSTPIDVPKQEVITKDNVTVGVDAVVYFRVINAPKAVLETTNYIYATSQFAQAALRDVTGNVDMDDLLAKREEISQQIKEIVDAETDKWGIDVENVKIQNIELPAAETLAQAAEILAKTQGAINLRTLNTLERISTEPSQKTMMLFPIELIDAIRGGKKE